MLFLPFNWPFNFDYPSMRDTVAVLIYVVTIGLDLKLWVMWQRRHEVKEAPAAARGRAGEAVAVRAARPGPKLGGCDGPHRRQSPRCRTSSTDYQLQEVDPAFLTQSVKPKQFLHIDQEECILCEGCVDICPWKCIHMVSVGAIAEAVAPTARARTRGTTWPSSSTRTCAPAAPSASTGARPA